MLIPWICGIHDTPACVVSIGDISNISHVSYQSIYIFIKPDIPQCTVSLSQAVSRHCLHTKHHHHQCYY